MILGQTDGLVKIIAEKNADGTAGTVLGVHMVGPWVTEQLGQGYLAVNWEATVDDIAAFIQPHPSLSRAVRRDGAGHDRTLAPLSPGHTITVSTTTREGN